MWQKNRVKQIIEFAGILQDSSSSFVYKHFSKQDLITNYYKLLAGPLFQYKVGELNYPNFQCLLNFSELIKVDVVVPSIPDFFSS